MGYNKVNDGAKTRAPIKQRIIGQHKANLLYQHGLPTVI